MAAGPLVCGNCGAPIQPGQHFCTTCGAEVAASAQPTVAAAQPSATPRPAAATGITRQQLALVLVAFAAGIVLVAAFVILTRGGGGEESPSLVLPEVPVNVDSAARSEVEAVAAHLPDLEGDTDRDQVRSFLGQPDAFTISFEPSGENADGPIVRHELWYYYDLGTVYEFADGALVMNMPSTLPVGPTILPSQRYDPALFQRDTSLDAIASLLDDPASLEAIPVEQEYGIPLTFYASEQLLVAFDEDGLFYVETVPLSLDEAVDGS
jgi:hypothetical protein